MRTTTRAQSAFARAATTTTKARDGWAATTSRSREVKRAATRNVAALRVESGVRGDDAASPEWVEGMVTFWLDEEWERGAAINADIGRAAAESYAKCVERAARVEAETGEVDDEAFQRMVMTLANDLLAFDFTDSFVSAFEVANKVIEMLMLRQGVDVCCVSEEDLTREERYLAWLDSGGSR